MSLAPIVILACGNPSRGDDALGPLLLDRLQGWLDEQQLADGFELIGDFQWQVEHALDLVGRQCALFIDAGEHTPAPFVLARVEALAQTTPSTHALSPAAVLAVLARISDQPPPPVFVLCVAAERFGLGEGLSAAAVHHAERAFELLQTLCQASRFDAWTAQLSA
ncbi:MAG: hydrogenase maturation protease [Candidatus Accumulibacter sp. UW26]|jgi:hydrogenase maturation protease